MFGFKKERKALEQKISELTAVIDSINKNMYENGLHLAEHTFIPEYLGFVPNILYDENESVRATIYSKDGFHVSKYVNTDRDEWVVVNEKDRRVKNEVIINSMLDAFTILNACGMTLDIQEYVKNGKL